MTDPTRGRIIRLVERRPRELTLRRAHVAWLRGLPGSPVRVEMLGERRFRVEARTGVGVACGPGVTLVVRPKVGTRVLSHLLGGDSPGPGVVSGDFFDLIADRFAGALGRYIDHEGLRSGYEARPNTAARGRIDFAAQARTPPHHAHELPAVADEFSPDRPAHRLILRAARRLASLPVLGDSRPTGSWADPRRLTGSEKVVDDGLPLPTAEFDGADLPPNGAAALALAAPTRIGAVRLGLVAHDAVVVREIRRPRIGPAGRP